MTKNKLGYVTINGKENYKISVFDHGLLYGDGVYETIRIFNGRAFLLERHLDRLYNSAKGIYLNIPYPKTKLISIIKSTYKESKLVDAFMRIIITRGVGEQGLASKSKPNLIIICNSRYFKPLEKISVLISKVHRINKRALDPKIKSLNYENNILAYFDAKNKNFNDAILLNEKNMITEATTTNLFIFKDEKLYTPSLESGILNGVIRETIIENFQVTEKELSVDDLLNAEEAFLSGTVNLITSISKVNDKKFNKFEKAKEVFNKLIELTEKGVLLR